MASKSETEQLLGDRARVLIRGTAVDSPQNDDASAAASLEEDSTAWTTKSHAEVYLGGSADIYEAVLVACFGGLKMDVGEGKLVRVHPIFPLLLSLPVFAVQVSLALFLLVSSDLNKPFKECSGDDCTMEHTEGMVVLKLVLIFIVFLSSFKLIEASVVHFLFVMNPVTWLEVQHLEMDQAGLFRALPPSFTRAAQLLTIVPCCIASTMMAFSMIYLVNTSSVTVILQTAKVPDAIFNSLAVSFICDLSETWWVFCSDTLRFGDIDGHEFRLRDQATTWSKDGKLLKGSCIAKGIVRLTTLPRMKSSPLRIGFGALRVRHITSTFIMATVLIHQIVIVFGALMAGLLPAFPDLCAFYRLVKINPSWSILYHFCMFDIKEELERQFDEFKHEDAHDIICSKFVLGFYHTSLEEEWGLLQTICRDAWHFFWPCLCFVFVVLVLPNILFELLRACTRRDAPDATSKEPDGMASQLASLQVDMSKMKEQNDQLMTRLKDATSTSEEQFSAHLKMLKDEISKLKTP